MTKEQKDAMRQDMLELMNAWDQVYAEAKRKGPHNPKGTDERAEQLARAYMSGVLRNHHGRLQV